MLATQSPIGAAERPRDRAEAVALQRTQEIVADSRAAFGVLCDVEKWPLWLSFLKSARRLEPGPLRIGSEVAVRGAIPGEDEELYEVDGFLAGHVVSLVGAYSVRRRIEFRIERIGQRSRVVGRLTYPAYGGFLGSLIDRMTARRRLDVALADSLVHLKGLVEYRNAREEPLADF